MNNLLNTNILLLKKKWGITQEKLGDLLGLSQAVVSNIIKGRREIDAESLIRLEEISGIPARKLYRQQIDFEEITEHPLKTYQPSYGPPKDFVHRVEEMRRDLDLYLKKLKSNNDNS